MVSRCQQHRMRSKREGGNVRELAGHWHRPAHGSWSSDLLLNAPYAAIWASGVNIVPGRGLHARFLLFAPCWSTRIDELSIIWIHGPHKRL